MSRTVVTLPAAPEGPLPPGFAGPDVRFPPALAEYVLGRFTRPGDVVFDPFAGFGTTLRIAEAMGRVPYGIEWDAARVAYARGRLRRPETLLHGDSRRLREYDALPAAFDFSLTSPPYMARGDREDPLAGYSEPGAGYGAYLRGLRAVYAQIGERLRDGGGRAVIEAANLKAADGSVTTLAWDVAAAVSEVLRFEGEIVVAWEPTYGFGYDHSYCLVFARP